MTEIRSLNRTLDQELLALMRGASLECLVCGEFVLHRHGDVECPECGFLIHARNSGEPGLQLGLQAG
jgi:Zn finger protein HypA/HybF involved in hydrogenase expression